MGFPETRDLTKDVLAGKVAARGQNRYSKVDVLTPEPVIYRDTNPLPSPELLAALTPSPQILMYGDGLPYPGFLRSFSVADMPNFEWSKLIGLVTFLLLPNFAPFQDDSPFFSHRSIVKNIVATLRTAKKMQKPTTIWLAYESRADVSDVELATILDRRIDLIPALGFLWLIVVCPIAHYATRHSNSEQIVTSPSPTDHPLILFQLTSFPLPKSHIPKTIGYFPRDVDVPDSHPTIHKPKSTLYHLRLDIPTEINKEIDGTEVRWRISGSLPLMLLINGLSPDDSSTILNEIQIPRITKSYWPIMIKSAPEGFKLFDFFVPYDVLGKFYDEQPALMEWGISIGLLDRSIKEPSIIITHQPKFEKGQKPQKKMPANDIRVAIEMNQPLYRKFGFLVLLNKYDLFGMVHEPMLVQPTVQEVENMGDLICISAHTQQRVFAREVARQVEPPYALVRFSPAFSVPDILQSVACFGPVASHQIFQQSGTLMVKYQSLDSARIAYGATLPGPVYVTSGSESLDATLPLATRLEKVSLVEMPHAVLNETNLAAVRLKDFSVPDLNSHPRSPVPSAPPSAAPSASSLFR